MVVHLAARVYVMNETAADPLKAFQTVNVEGALNLAKLTKVAGVKRFLFLSSIGVNGSQTSLGKPFPKKSCPSLIIRMRYQNGRPNKV